MALRQAPNFLPSLSLFAAMGVALAGCGAEPPGPERIDDDCGAECVQECGDGVCHVSESCASCAADCGACFEGCGDGACGLNESCGSCAADCGSCAAMCGDGLCLGGESCGSCAADCGSCAAMCGDGVCAGGESCGSCATDCGSCAAVCGDGLCAGGESCGSCAADCGSCGAVCGNAVCEGGESCGSCAADCGACAPPLFQGTTCVTVDRGFPALGGGSLDEVVRSAAEMGRAAFGAWWDPEIEPGQMYAVMTWVLNTLRQNGVVAFRSLLPGASVAAPAFEDDKTTVRAGDGSQITFDMFGSWQNPGSPQALIFDALVPYETPDLLSCAGVDNDVLPNSIFPGGGNPGGSGQPPTELTAADAANVLAAAQWVRANRPEFFAADDRAVAYDMMTVVINHARGLGTDAMRCLAHPSLPPSNPYRWCSDALVVGQPGLGIAVDVYGSWPDPANPQLLVTRTGDTGEMTADLNP